MDWVENYVKRVPLNSLDSIDVEQFKLVLEFSMYFKFYEYYTNQITHKNTKGKIKSNKKPLKQALKRGSLELGRYLSTRMSEEKMRTYLNKVGVEIYSKYWRLRGKNTGLHLMYGHTIGMELYELALRMMAVVEEIDLMNLIIHAQREYQNHQTCMLCGTLIRKTTDTYFKAYSENKVMCVECGNKVLYVADDKKGYTDKWNNYYELYKGNEKE